MTEVATAARRYLLGLADVASLVQQRVYKYALDVPVDGTGQAAVVVHPMPGWATPDPVQSSEFPRLAVDCHADPSRVPGTGEVAVADAEDKAFALARAIIPWFRYPRLWGEWMGGFGSRPGLYVVTTAQWAEPRIVEGHPGNVGDIRIVRAEFALQVLR